MRFYNRQCGKAGLPDDQHQGQVFDPEHASV